MPMKIDGMTPHGASVTMAHDHDEKTQGTDADFGAELFDQLKTLFEGGVRLWHNYSELAARTEMSDNNVIA